MYDFSGKYAVVTGASKGIGKAIAKRLFDEGAHVAILARSVEGAAAAAKEFDPEGTRTLAVACDVGNFESVQAAFAKIYEAFGRVDMLINNAGVTADVMFHKMPIEKWDSVINTNLNSLYYCCSQVIPQMREQEYGKIVNISSVSALGNAGQANYSASKGACISFTRTLAKESARKNINVNTISPGMIETDMMNAVPAETLAGFKKSIPLGRMGQPEDVAALAAFLCSEEASFITGVEIRICGGTQTI